MKKSNHLRYVPPFVFNHLCLNFGVQSPKTDRVIGEILGRCEKSINRWRAGANPVPRWAYEMLRLTLDDRRRSYQRMTGVSRGAAFLKDRSRLNPYVGQMHGVCANDEFYTVPVRDVEIQN